jgi:hypothetical protein
MTLTCRAGATDARACFGAPDGRRAGLTVRAANSGGFRGTPSFLVGPSGGGMKKLEYTSLTEPTSFNDAIEQLLQS